MLRIYAEGYTRNVYVTGLTIAKYRQIRSLRMAIYEHYREQYYRKGSKLKNNRGIDERITTKNHYEFSTI